MFANSEELLRYLRDEDVKFVDVRFCDLPGVMQHFTLPVESFDDSVFTDGLAFDGSSIRGFQAIHESDMLLLPDVASAFVDPFRIAKTVALNFFIHDPFTREPYSRDPRNVAKKAEAYLASSGIADTAFFGPEAEFYIFDSIRHSTSANEAFYHIDSIEGWWNSGKEEPGGNRGYKTAYKGGYFPVPPVDHYADLRDKMVTNLINSGFTIERAHHEVGTAGQAEINYKFSTLLHSGDQVQLFKYIVKNTAWAEGKTATFMPKPLFGDNGSGMHTHQSLWANGEPLFYDETGYGGLSDTARWYIGGLLTHAPSLLAFTNRRSTRTVAWCRASRRRSTWSTRRVTGPPAPASRSPAPTRRPSASSSACRTRRATRTWRSPPCCWPAWTASRTRSSRRPRSTRTSTTSRRRRSPTSSRCRAPSTPCSTSWRPTTSTSPRAASSPRT